MYVCMTSRNSITSPPDVAIHNAKVGSIGTDVSDVMTNVDVRMCEGESCVSVCEFALRESMLTFCLCAFCTPYSSAACCATNVQQLHINMLPNVLIPVGFCVLSAAVQLSFL